MHVYNEAFHNKYSFFPSSIKIQAFLMSDQSKTCPRAKTSSMCVRDSALHGRPGHPVTYGACSVALKVLVCSNSSHSNQVRQCQRKHPQHMFKSLC